MRNILFAAVLAVASGQTALAAHAGAPYTNVDRRNDAGNDTGDAQVDRLNAQQLDRNYRGPFYPAPSALPAYQPPYAPAPRYAAPPYYRPAYPPRY